jgi:hypothetical protein
MGIAAAMAAVMTAAAISTASAEPHLTADHSFDYVFNVVRSHDGHHINSATLCSNGSATSAYGSISTLASKDSCHRAEGHGGHDLPGHFDHDID